MKVKVKENQNYCQSCGKKSNKKVCNVCVGLVLKPIKEAEQKEKKEKEKMTIEVKSNENRKALQREINKLSRLIDAKFNYTTCIDCNKPFLAQTDAAHFHDLSTNRGVRYHLDNLHSSRSSCNQFSSKHKEGYKLGLQERYGQDYHFMVLGLKHQYKEVNLNAFELKEKLALVRKIIRNFDTFQFENSITARTSFNNIIGIYKNNQS